MSYRAYRAQWNGEGAGLPAVALQRASGYTDAYVSWNGDTRVARWTVLAGKRAADLVPIGSVPANGLRDRGADPRALHQHPARRERCGRSRAGRLRAAGPLSPQTVRAAVAISSTQSSTPNFVALITRSYSDGSATSRP